eukprot:g39024.t1
MKKGLFSLECRRLRGNLIEVYKILNGMGRVESMRCFYQGGEVNNYVAPVQSAGGMFKRDVRDRIFTQRVKSAWNVLPEEVVEADIITAFKKHLDEYMNRKGIEGY